MHGGHKLVQHNEQGLLTSSSELHINYMLLTTTHYMYMYMYMHKRSMRDSHLKKSSGASLYMCEGVVVGQSDRYMCR